MHLDDERLERLLHGELAPEIAGAARTHLLECAECRARVAAAEREEREVFALIGAVDHPVPAISLEMVLERARSRPAAWHRWAAAALLTVGLGGAAYALPGSPIRRWVDAAIMSVAGPSEQAAPQAEPGAEPVDGAGIALSPGDGLVIAFAGPAEGGSARIAFTSGAEVTIRAPSGAATFRAESDQVLVQRAGVPARFDIEIPASAPRVEVRVGARTIFLKDGARVVTEVEGGPDGTWLVPLDVNVE